MDAGWVGGLPGALWLGWCVSGVPGGEGAGGAARCTVGVVPAAWELIGSGQYRCMDGYVVPVGYVDVAGGELVEE